jgi:hypothetical protein
MLMRLPLPGDWLIGHAEVAATAGEMMVFAVTCGHDGTVYASMGDTVHRSGSYSHYHLL